MADQNKFQFKDLEILLSTYPYGVLLSLENVEYGNRCYMWLFRENFSDAYKSGDGILLYDDGETHSANAEDEFILLDKIIINKKAP